MRRLQAARLIGMNWDMKQHEGDPPGRDPRFWLRDPTDTDDPLAADVAAVRRYLDLEPGRNDFQLTEYPFKRQPNQVGIRCRSLLGVLYFLSQSVEPPPADVQAGLVTVTRDEDGNVFDWSKVTRKIMTVHSQADRPQRAAVAVRHRGTWFYIADDDQTSKSTFGLLNILFSLQSSSGEANRPC